MPIPFMCIKNEDKCILSCFFTNEAIRIIISTNRQIQQKSIYFENILGNMKTVAERGPATDGTDFASVPVIRFP